MRPDLASYRVLANPGEFSAKHVKIVEMLVRSAERQKFIHPRPAGWVGETVRQGYAKAIVHTASDKLVCFFVIRPVPHGDSRVVYGEGCFWRNDEPHTRDIIHWFSLNEARKMGKSLYIAVYKHNLPSLRFYSQLYGFRRIREMDLPVYLYNKLKADLSKIVTLCNSLEIIKNWPDYFECGKLNLRAA